MESTLRYVALACYLYKIGLSDTLFPQQP